MERTNGKGVRRQSVRKSQTDGLVPVPQGDEQGEDYRPESSGFPGLDTIEPGFDKGIGDVVDLSFRVKMYEDAVLGFNWRGWLTPEYCLAVFRTDAPPSAVIIESSLRIAHESRVVMPHPECKARHDELEVEHWTVATVRAFPDVEDRHKDAVRRIGEKNRVVNVPVMEELTLGDIR